MERVETREANVESLQGTIDRKKGKGERGENSGLRDWGNQLVVA